MHKVIVTAENQAKLDELLDFCKTKWGHRGKQSGWYWKVRKSYRDKKFIFSFDSEEDAIIFKLSKG